MLEIIKTIHSTLVEPGKTKYSLVINDCDSNCDSCELAYEEYSDYDMCDSMINIMNIYNEDIYKPSLKCKPRCER